MIGMIALTVEMLFAACKWVARKWQYIDARLSGFNKETADYMENGHVEDEHIDLEELEYLREQSFNKLSPQAMERYRKERDCAR